MQKRRLESIWKQVKARKQYSPDYEIEDNICEEEDNSNGIQTSESIRYCLPLVADGLRAWRLTRIYNIGNTTCGHC